MGTIGVAEGRGVERKRGGEEKEGGEGKMSGREEERFMVKPNEVITQFPGSESRTEYIFRNYS